MKKKKIKEPYLQICDECGRHACIILSGGKESLEFPTIAEGIKVVRTLQKSGDLTEDEASSLEDEINISELPPLLSSEPKGTESLLLLFVNPEVVLPKHRAKLVFSHCGVSIECSLCGNAHTMNPVNSKEKALSLLGEVAVEWSLSDGNCLEIAKQIRESGLVEK
jgi:hypothetical protein